MSDQTVVLGDCRDVLQTLDACSVDAVVCDPPYELGFMGKGWDSAGVSFQPETWAHAFRVLKPGGHLLAFGGTRTYHRIAVAIEDAGFDIRDCLCWLYGSGFPKSHDVAKAIDKRLGVEGGYGDYKTPDHAVERAVPSTLDSRPWHDDEDAVERNLREYLPGSEQAAAWQGWGTALKPAFEPIVLARKPLDGTVAANVLAHGVGALNVDATRVGDSKDVPASPSQTDSDLTYGTYGVGDGRVGSGFDPNVGRWPANVLFTHHPDCVELGPVEVRGTGHTPSSRPSSTFAANAQADEVERSWRREVVTAYDCHPDCPVGMLDAQSGTLSSGAPGTMRLGENSGPAYGAESRPPGTPMTGYGDSGGASRFFYLAKATRAERNAGLDGVNQHPTVKPINLMRWLIRLVTPLGGLVVDPFAGSGSTGCACAVDGVRFLGVEEDASYVPIADARIAWWALHGEDGFRLCSELEAGARRRAAVEDAGQLDIFA